MIGRGDLPALILFGAAALAPVVTRDGFRSTA